MRRAFRRLIVTLSATQTGQMNRRAAESSAFRKISCFKTKPYDTLLTNHRRLSGCGLPQGAVLMNAGYMCKTTKLRSGITALARPYAAGILQHTSDCGLRKQNQTAVNRRSGPVVVATRRKAESAAPRSPSRIPQERWRSVTPDLDRDHVGGRCIDEPLVPACS